MLTVIEEQAVKKALDHASERWDRTDSAWEALIWTLARDPEAGAPVTESGKTRSMVFEGARSIDMPTIEVIYINDDPYLIIASAEFRNADAQYAGKA